MSSAEFTEWMAFNSVEPITGWRTDYHTAQIVAAIVNVNRGRKQPLKLDKFLPDYWNERGQSEKTPEQLLGIVEMLNAAFGGQDLRGQKKSEEANGDTSNTTGETGAGL